MWRVAAQNSEAFVVSSSDKDEGQSIVATALIVESKL